MINNVVIYRAAKIEDSADLAQLSSIASAGIIDYLFHALIPGMSSIDIVAHNLEGDNYPHSYKSAVVAEYYKMVVGMILSYPSYLHGITKEMKSFFPEERLEHLRSFYSAKVEGSMYIDALCVQKEFRCKGIGSELINLTKQRAKELGHKKLSLIVLADNRDAQRLYERHGFEVVQRIDLASNEFIPHEGGCLLMRCEIN
jgi:ribosomal protein S18 acetylase RimI-like enzyme